MLRRKFRLCVMAEHISLLKEIVQQAWDNKESTHLDALEEKVQDAPNCQGTIYYLDEEETNALILILLKRLEVQK